MDIILDKSKNWVGPFSKYKNEISSTLMNSPYFEDIKKAYISYLSGKQLNNLVDTDYCKYNKTVYKNITFDDDTVYKIREINADYDFYEIHTILYIEER